jgi:hypothetical protein
MDIDGVLEFEVVEASLYEITFEKAFHHPGVHCIDDVHEGDLLRLVNYMIPVECQRCRRAQRLSYLPDFERSCLLIVFANALYAMDEFSGASIDPCILKHDVLVSYKWR